MEYEKRAEWRLAAPPAAAAEALRAALERLGMNAGGRRGRGDRELPAVVPAQPLGRGDRDHARAVRGREHRGLHGPHVRRPPLRDHGGDRRRGRAGAVRRPRPRRARDARAQGADEPRADAARVRARARRSARAAAAGASSSSCSPTSGCSSPTSPSPRARSTSSRSTRSPPCGPSGSGSSSTSPARATEVEDLAPGQADELAARFRALRPPAPEAPADDADPIVLLERLAALRDQGVIEPAEFEAKKAELLRRI